MSNYENLLIVLQFFGGLLSLWFAYYHAWKPTGAAWVRQRLFCVRQELFRLALEGKISFHSKEYKQLFSQLNSLIRYSSGESGWTLWFLEKVKLHGTRPVIHNKELRHIQLSAVKVVAIYYGLFSISGAFYMLYKLFAVLLSPKKISRGKDYHRPEAKWRTVSDEAFVLAAANADARKRSSNLTHDAESERAYAHA